MVRQAVKRGSETKHEGLVVVPPLGPIHDERYEERPG